MGDGTFVGLDVHARGVVAGLIAGATGEVRAVRAPHATDELVSWLGTLAGPVQTTYEAGPTGYGLARSLREAGIGCLVAAPSLIPRASGDRVKNDRRDAERLACLLRAGELVGVDVPRPADGAARDLVRAREDARADLMRARHRLSKMLLRYGRVYDKGRHTRGPITKTGNGHARRLVVEAAWHHRRAHRRSAELERRREGCRPEVRARAEAAGGTPSPALAEPRIAPGPARDDRRGGRRSRAGGLVLEPGRDGRLSIRIRLGEESAPDGRLTPREAMRD